MQRFSILIVLAVIVAACSGGAESTTSSTTPTVPATTAAPTTAGPGSIVSPATTVPPPPFAGGELLAATNELFAASGVCAVCHQDLTDGIEDVSIDATWRSTMMANAAKDPYWQATVAAEIEANPGYDAVLQDKCATCHTPMARASDAIGGDGGVLYEGGYLDPAGNLHELGIDGVSCTLCHQIEPDNLGTEESFSGGFLIDPDLPERERLTYGPYVSPPGQAAIMQSASGFVPVQGLHVQESELCASCHTLYTPTVDPASGEVVGLFPEQAPYLEWQASEYGAMTSCQDCHMPEALGSVQLSITGGPARSPFSKHHFVGGNTLVLSMFRLFGEEMEVTASSDHFDATIARVEDQLTSRTAAIDIVDATVTGGELAAAVAIASEVGHKFPSGFPSRRAWLHVTVRDAAGSAVFESGGWSPDGSIAGNDNDADPSAYEPHYTAITESGQVQIYESMLADAAGDLTTVLLYGASYVKDNRLLPAGFDKNAAAPDIAVSGAAAADPDFTGGGDTVVYRIDVGGATGPFTIEAELLYQAIGYRWADNLRPYGIPDTQRFTGYYDTVGNAPVVVAAASATS